MRIVVIGGHGKIALLLAPLLTQTGHRVEAWIRDPDQAAAVEATGAEAVLADVEQLNVAEMTERLTGRDAVIWTAGAGGGNPRRTYAVDRDAAIRSMDAAVAGKVSRYLMVSYTRSGRDPDVGPDDGFYPYAEAKAAADAHLRHLSLNWTILGPGRLTDGNGTGLVEVGHHVTCGDTARANVARVALAVIGRTDLNGVTLCFRDGNVPIAEALQVASVG